MCCDIHVKYPYLLVIGEFLWSQKFRQESDQKKTQNFGPKMYQKLKFITSNLGFFFKF